MATEDLTTFTESDASGVVTVTASRMTATGITGLMSSTGVIKDYGANFFDALNCGVTGNYVSSVTGAGTYNSFGFSTNTSDNGYGGMAIPDILVTFNDDGGGGTLVRISIMRGSFASYDNVDGLAKNTPYYVHVIREAGNTNISMLVYADAAHTTLLDTLAVTGASNTKYQYLKALTHAEDGENKAITLYYEDFDLDWQGPPGGGSGGGDEDDGTQGGDSRPDVHPFGGGPQFPFRTTR